MKKRFLIKSVCIYLAFNILVCSLVPPLSMALTSGPASPEFSSFEPVATTDMVNVFSGDMTYNLPVINIPGPNGAGYALSLSYHSGVSPEEEASWVGFGWTLNPGSINRNKRGFPDEDNGTKIKHYNKQWPNWTKTASQTGSLEFFSVSDRKLAEAKDEEPFSSFPSIDISQMIRYNNYQGMNRTASVGVGYKGTLGISANIGASGVTYSGYLSVPGILNLAKTLARRKREKELVKVFPEYYEARKAYKRATGKSPLTNRQKNHYRVSRLFNQIRQGIMSNATLSSYNMTAFETGGVSPVTSKYRGFGLNFNTSVSVRPLQAPVGFEIGMGGSFQMQYNVPVADYEAYGYLHTNSENTHSNGADPDNPDSDGSQRLEDYFVEKENTFDIRDLYIGIPFSNYDVFSLTGEGLSGGFRAFNLKTGHYYPNYMASNVTTLNTGVEVAAGLNLGIGLDFGLGNTKSRIKNWSDDGNTDSYQYDTNDNAVFRFNNDLGGKVEYAGSTKTKTAELIVKPKFPGIKNASPHVDESDIYKYANNAESADKAKAAVGRSSFVNPQYENGRISGFTIVKEDGSNYKYGQSVMSKNEVSLSVNVEPQFLDPEDLKTVYKTSPLKESGVDDGRLQEFSIVMGESREGDAKYTTTFLLTEITSPDYIDLDGSGDVSDADLGGWTKFSYSKSVDNYRWKVPYHGLDLDLGQLSRRKDDVGGVATGQKEVWYLRNITTRTHKAYFVTNKNNGGYCKITPSGIDRKDGLDASIITDVKAYGSNTLERLEKIVLVARQSSEEDESQQCNERVLKTVNFGYSYQLVPQTPNNINTRDQQPDQTGKLTLKRVWFEYEGVVSARISPYEFYYQYKDTKSFTGIKEKYNDAGLNQFLNLSNTYSANAQNPVYSKYAVDGWGGLQPEGESQDKKLRSWRYQGNLDPKEEFDPAAYQLKQIKLPSGGEIMIEYEEKDYLYVQGNDAMAMVSLKSYDHNDHGLFDKDGAYDKTPSYILNLDDIGATAAEAQKIADKIRDYYIGQHNRIFFKFLFQLHGDGDPAIQDCRSEYIDGYAIVKEVTYDAGRNEVKITLDGENKDGYKNYSLIPRQGCYDFYVTHRIGKFSDEENPNCECKIDEYDDKMKELSEQRDLENPNFFQNLVNFLDKLATSVDQIVRMEVDVLNPDYNPPLKRQVCKKINTELSYLKIPMVKAKKGGGIRVKRLLTYDPGIVSGEAGSIFGSKYTYELEDGRTSGVATNEPGSQREENPLVGFLPKDAQKWSSRLAIGKDKEQSEGPVGESLLPPASVGYSRVVIENVHNTGTATGFAIHTFYTCHEYPVNRGYSYADRPAEQVDFKEESGVDYTYLKNNSAKDNVPVNAGLFSYHSKKFWNTQGYKFILNAMHGLPNTIEKYSGTYSDYKLSRSNVALVFSHNSEYYLPGEKVQVLSGKNGQVTVEWDTPGKEMDIAMEAKTVKERHMEFTLEVDLSVGLSAPPPPFLSFSAMVEFAENSTSLHSTSKVISYPAIPKSVKTYQEGIWSEVAYIGFDKATGQSIITRTTDIYDDKENKCQVHKGDIYTTVLPAYWYYDDMGQKSVSADKYNLLSASAGTIITHGENGNPLKNGEFKIPVTGVIDAKIQTFARGSENAWFTSSVIDEYMPAGLPDDITPEVVKGKLDAFYRPSAQYVYKTDVTSVTASSIKGAGIYTGFAPFKFDGSNSDAWVKISEITKYSPHGIPLEEEDVQEIPSASRYSKNNLPSVIGANAQYGSLLFEDFEETTDNGTNSIAHSGEKSKAVADGKALLGTVVLGDRLKNSSKGAFVRAWIRSDIGIRGSEMKLSADQSGSDPGKGVFAEYISRSGEWSLYQFNFSKSYLSGFSADQKVYLLFTTPLAGADIFIDDVKFQPAESEVNCFVYDTRSLRLVTEFDDQHFGVYYQYNQEGKLVRKIIETERGMKTVQENQYNLPKTDRKVSE
jgi:hypothetical protein